MTTLIARLTAASAAAGLLLCTLMTAPAGADTVSQIADGLSRSRLYVTTEARGALDPAGQERVRRALEAAEQADIRAVVTKPDVTQQSLIRMLDAVRARVGRGDTYLAVTADNRMLGISDELSGREINRLISQTSGGDIDDRLVEFAALAEREAARDARSGAITTFTLLGLLVLVTAGLVVIGLVSGNRRRRRAELQMAELKEGVQEDITRLGEDIVALDLNVTDPSLDPAIREEYEQALNSYDAAKAAVEAARRPEDMRNVTAALEDGRYHMTAVRARLAGEPVPERRPPCFFNPQHGPSVRDVLWAPPGGAPRDVPACAADADAVENGADPDARLVPVDGVRRPYWEAGPAYAPYAGGYYRGYGGVDLLSGLLIGTALGSMFSGPYGGWGFGGGHMGGYGGEGGFGGDSGGIGGGWDFGSGDFGGGDFGGGDF
ncbi:hypothetical protein [Thermomonospora catenispora]|uniref:hypothetical protein n=1 Tax=Thermomonospora catenispora TaxID=2493090 RepID=UPI00111FB383|nr:hypothetical protein [Thermomonospora catenispora]TNY38676.1 hypothetical protein EIO00_00250 [Thermomonospora catenispora]